MKSRHRRSRATRPGFDLSQVPAEFEPWTYRSLHSDLWFMSDAELREHYERVGRAEGRRSHPISDRGRFRDIAIGARSILEIGPFFKPMFVGPNVRYFDVLDRQGLLDHAAKLGFADVHVPDIDYVSPTGDLSIVTETFDVVSSSHAIEHQPDLVGHLSQVERLLVPGGIYHLFVPDKRYCFDYFVPESTIADVIEAAIEQRRLHSLRSFMKQTMNTHNDSKRHWNGDHGRPENHNADAISAALAEYERSTSSGTYVDRHAWQFTPTSFRTIVNLLNELGMINLRPARIYDTLAAHHEFWSILLKP